MNHLGHLNLPRKSVVRLTDHADMTTVVYHGRKTTQQQQSKEFLIQDGGFSSQTVSEKKSCLMSQI